MITVASGACANCFLTVVQEESLAFKAGESDDDRDKRLARNLYMRFSRSLKSALLNHGC